jgi:hypothetical protein
LQIDGKWQTEVVRDPTVVNAYLRQRRLIDEQESSAEALMPSDDPEKNRLAKRRLAIQQLLTNSLIGTPAVVELLFLSLSF